MQEEERKHKTESVDTRKLSIDEDGVWVVEETLGCKVKRLSRAKTAERGTSDRVWRSRAPGEHWRVT